MLLGGIAAAAVILSLIICAAAGGFTALQWLWMMPVFFLGWMAVLLGLTVLGLWLLCRTVDLTKPREEDSPFFRKLVIQLARSVLILLQTKVQASGLEQMPRDGRFLLVCNHLHLLDPVVLLAMFPNSQLAFISKKENTGLFLVGKLMHMILCQPIDRDNDREALKTILKCIRLIKEDKASVAVFPEGYTSKDGRLHHFRCGVFKIAQKADVPIVVCTVQNTQKMFHNAARLRRTQVQLHLLQVIPAPQLKGVTAVEIGSRVFEIMARDLGEDLVCREETPT